MKLIERLQKKSNGKVDLSLFPNLKDLHGIDVYHDGDEISLELEIYDAEFGSEWYGFVWDFSTNTFMCSPDLPPEFLDQFVIWINTEV